MIEAHIHVFFPIEAKGCLVYTYRGFPPFCDYFGMFLRQKSNEGGNILKGIFPFLRPLVAGKVRLIQSVSEGMVWTGCPYELQAFVVCCAELHLWTGGRSGGMCFVSRIPLKDAGDHCCVFVGNGGGVCFRRRLDPWDSLRPSWLFE